jgi:hypothetical protein
MQSVAEFRRALTVGSKWEMIYRQLPHTTSVRPVSSVHSSYVKFETMKADGTIVHSRLDIPKASLCIFAGDTVHILNDYTKWDGTREILLSYRKVS